MRRSIVHQNLTRPAQRTDNIKTWFTQKSRRRTTTFRSIVGIISALKNSVKILRNNFCRRLNKLLHTCSKIKSSRSATFYHLQSACLGYLNSNSTFAMGKVGANRSWPMCLTKLSWKIIYCKLSRKSRNQTKGQAADWKNKMNSFKAINIMSLTSRNSTFGINNWTNTRMTTTEDVSNF